MTSTNVLNFSTASRSNSRDAIRTSLLSLPWKLKSSLILRLMGIESSPKVELNWPVSRSSEFYDMGFNTLGEACSGLALDGEEIERSIRCFYYSEHLGAPGETQEQVSESYQDVKRALGRDPVSAMEYSRVEAKIREARISNLEIQKEESERKVSEAMAELRSAEDEVRNRESVISRLKGESLEMKSNLESEIAGIKKKHKSTIEEIIEDSKKKLAHAVSEAESREKLRATQEKRTLLKEKEEEISKLRAEGDERYGQLKSYISTNYISLSEYDAVKLECDQLREINRNNLVKLNNLDGIDHTIMENAHLQQIEELRDRLRKLELAYIAMEKAYKAYREGYRRIKNEVSGKDRVIENPSKEVKNIIGKGEKHRDRVSARAKKNHSATWLYAFSTIMTGTILTVLTVL